MRNTLVALLLLTACNSDHYVSPEEAGPYPANWEEITKEWLDGWMSNTQRLPYYRMTPPRPGWSDGTRFPPRHGWLVCGRINPKFEFEGYPFFVLIRDSRVIEGHFISCGGWSSGYSEEPPGGAAP